MNATLARLLLRLSEAGEPAILWGRQAKHHFGRSFDRLLADGILIEQAPADEWDICPAYECGADSRVIQRVNGRPIAPCPLDRNLDAILDDDDLRSFRIVRSALVDAIAKYSGFDAPSEVVPAIWRIGKTPSGNVVFIALDRSALAQPGVLAALRTAVSGASIGLIGPPLSPAEQVRFREAGVTIVTINSAFVDGEAGGVIIDPAALEPAPIKVRLVMKRISKTVELDGATIALPDQPFQLLWLLAGRARSEKPFVPPRDIENEIYGQLIHRVTRPARDIVRELRGALKTQAPNSPARSLIQNKRGFGWRLTLSALEISLDL
ncbi:MAG TPA: hypothetical protein VFG05_01640 [Methylocella sp.]|nr:hypothetical protein [Methylocella sp.]